MAREQARGREDKEMELIVFVLLVAMLGPAAMRWGADSTPAMPDGHRQQGQ